MGKIEQNFLWLTAANLTSTCLNAIQFIYLARVLEAENFGYLSYVGTLVVYLLNFIDLGLSTYGIREIARDRSRISEFVSNIISFKLIIAFILFTGFILISNLTQQPAIIKILMFEMALMCFVSALTSEWAFQGLEKMHMVFISFAVTPILQLLFNVLMVKGPGDILKVPLINFMASMPILIVFLRRLKFSFNIFRLDFKRIYMYLSSAIVIWSISIFAQVYNGLDIVFLGFFKSPEEVGCFTIARRFAGGSALFLVFLAGAVLPHLSCAYKQEDMSLFHQSTRKYLKLSGIALACIIVPIILFSRQLISMTVGSGYLPSALPLKIMMFAMIPVAINLPYSTGLVAARMEKEVLKQVCASAVFSIFLNFILMPRYGMIGASVSFVCAEVLALVWILWVYHKKIGIYTKRGG